ncbi:hypothetical protein RRG08_016500 [Elysia crispata]|uniref:Uncharacterized protein n=1 Tax=Elysia crispata TaxID=231223 RepID=A0AAE1CV29_9GAST|nr:hypothetical protein RRG08_016500 [Elysia crispata]
MLVKCGKTQEASIVRGVSALPACLPALSPVTRSSEDNQGQPPEPGPIGQSTDGRNTKHLSVVCDVRLGRNSSVITSSRLNMRYVELAPVGVAWQRAEGLPYRYCEPRSKRIRYKLALRSYTPTAFLWLFCL